MEVISKEEFLSKKQEFFRKIIGGAVFVYPTDTIYGIGCNAEDNEAVNRVRGIKHSEKPFSVIAPSKEWILENCNIKKDDKWLKKLPGPYTLIVKLKSKCVADSVNNSQDRLGIRIPKHWFSYVVSEIKVPIITTSANISGKDFMSSIEDLDDNIKDNVDFIIYEGEKKAKPSKIVNLVNGKITER